MVEEKDIAPYPPEAEIFAYPNQREELSILNIKTTVFGRLAKSQLNERTLKIYSERNYFKRIKFVF